MSVKPCYYAFRVYVGLGHALNGLVLLSALMLGVCGSGAEPGPAHGGVHIRGPATRGLALA